ncbi:uncharacterized protein L203_104190 [Cryptococcus depauperatus CBS 7841]|uniref:Uncharacterized protein n=1 Tax=Cryptococcus depauperatus CBS 7841 TaxID=1295531 RepID=A0A1E3HHY0_9TREE|nr:hypothetical protein L203_06497 [Cryptococcus depauperatus CBS 7841]
MTDNHSVKVVNPVTDIREDLTFAIAHWMRKDTDNYEPFPWRTPNPLFYKSVLLTQNPQRDSWPDDGATHVQGFQQLGAIQPEDPGEWDNTSFVVSGINFSALFNPESRPEAKVGSTLYAMFSDKDLGHHHPECEDSDCLGCQHGETDGSNRLTNSKRAKDYKPGFESANVLFHSLLSWDDPPISETYIPGNTPLHVNEITVKVMLGRRGVTDPSQLRSLTDAKTIERYHHPGCLCEFCPGFANPDLARRWAQKPKDMGDKCLINFLYKFLNHPETRTDAAEAGTITPNETDLDRVKEWLNEV